MPSVRERLIEALQGSFFNYQTYGPRSSKKLLPLHQFLASEMQRIWGSEYEIHVMGPSSKELRVTGSYYRKFVDIAVTRLGDPVLALSVKFITSNYGQNSNNYFESMLGETANIQDSGVPYSHFVFFRDPMPYKKKGGETSRHERITARQIAKYLKLAADEPTPHRPFAMCLHVVGIDDEGTVTDASFDPIEHGEGFEAIHAEQFSIESSLRAIQEYKTLHEAQID